jgi:peptidoglycan hydrolase CwlO-like protein
MAQENVGINITVGGNQDQALGSLKKQLKEATLEVQQLSDKFGATSEQAVNAAKKAAALKDEIGDSKALIEAFNPDAKFKAFSQTLGAVAGGFSAVQGALGLLGVEGEDVQKTLVKVQSALALSQGLEQLGDLGDAFKNLKTVAVTAFNGIKAAIGATGIGLLVIAIGSIVTYWDDIKELVSGVSDEQEKLNKLAEENLKKSEENLETLDGQTNQLRLQGKSEREILGLKIKQTDEAIKAAEVSIVNAKATKDAQVQAAKRNREILKGIIDFISTPIKFLLGSIDNIGKALGKDFGLLAAQEKANNMMASYIFDPVETAKEGDATIKEAEKVLNKFKEQKASSILALQNLDRQGAATAKSEADKKAEEENARIEKELAAEKKLTEDLLSEYEKRRKFRLTSRTITQKELAALDKAEEEENKKKVEAIDNERVAGQMKVMSATKNFTLQAIQTQQAASETEKQIEKQKTDDKLKELELQKQGAMAALDAVAGLIDQNSVAGKAIAVAKAVMSTYEGATKALGAYPPPFGAIAAAATVAAGLVNVKKIISTNIPSAKGTGNVGGGATAPSISSAAPIAPPQPQAATTNISTQSINALGNQAQRAYVVESDVTSSQQRMAAIQQRARFG